MAGGLWLVIGFCSVGLLRSAPTEQRRDTKVQLTLDASSQVLPEAQVHYLKPGETMKVNDIEISMSITRDSHPGDPYNDVDLEDTMPDVENTMYACDKAALSLVASAASARYISPLSPRSLLVVSFTGASASCAPPCTTSWFTCTSYVAMPLIVELITVSNFTYPAAMPHTNDDSEWWTQEENVNYSCPIGNTRDGVWIDPGRIPPMHFHQPPEARLSETNIYDSSWETASSGDISGDMIKYLNWVRGLTTETDAPKPDPQQLYTIPPKCSVHLRRLPAVDQRPAKGTSVSFPFSPDHSSALYAFRITHVSLPASNQIGGTHHLHIPGTGALGAAPVVKAVDTFITGGWWSQDDADKCYIPDRTVPATNPQDPDERVPNAFLKMSCTNVHQVRCHPIAHCPLCPMASHLGLYSLPKSGRSTPDPMVEDVLFVSHAGKQTVLNRAPGHTYDADRVRPLDGRVQADMITVKAGEDVEVVVRPFPEVNASLWHAVRHLTIYGRLSSGNRIVNVDVVADSNYNATSGVDGYVLRFNVREEGDYLLEVTVTWIYGDRDTNAGLVPINTGSHMGHQFGYCNHHRSMVYGSPFVVRVTKPEKAIQTWGNHKCTRADADGRWVFMEPGKRCAPPLCTGFQGEEDSIDDYGWHGEKEQWVWVPYTCYYHLYGKDDLKTCAAANDLNWLLILGDSQVRELMEHLHLIGGYGDVFGKFAALERPALVEGLRVTFQFFEVAFNCNPNVKDRRDHHHVFSRGWWPYLEHFNVRPSCTSGQPLSFYTPSKTNDPHASPMEECSASAAVGFRERETMPIAQRTRPDAVVFNAAMAYASEDVSWDELRDWVQDTLAYLESANVTSGDQPMPIKHDDTSQDVDGDTKMSCDELTKMEKESNGKQRAGLFGPNNESNVNVMKEQPLQVFWYGAPYVQSQAHPGSPYLTTARHNKFVNYAARHFRKAGIEVLDLTRVTQSRLEDSWDGLHYMRSTIEDPGHGIVSSMAQQIVLNALFRDCNGNSD